MTDQTASLRDRIARALYEKSGPGSVWAEAHEHDRLIYGDDADVVLAGLGRLAVPDDRAAVLREAADVAERVGRRVFADAPDERRGEGAWETAAELRRLAADAEAAS